MVTCKFKRIHEIQTSNAHVLHVNHLYDRIQRGEINAMVPPLRVDRWQAAPGYTWPN